MKISSLIPALAFATCLGCVSTTKDQYDIRPDDAYAGIPDAVRWQSDHGAELAAATSPAALAACSSTPAAADALLAKVETAYRTDPLDASRIAAVSQFVMRRTCAESPARRKVWTEALLRAAKASADGYRTMFMLDQLRWCGSGAQAGEIRAIGAAAGDEAVRAFAAQVADELEKTTGPASAAIAPERIGCCSWSWHRPMKDVAAQMEKAGITGVHLALGPFIAADGRHGAAETEEAWAFVKGKVARGEWRLMATMIGTVGEDYSTLETIRKTGGIVPDATWEANKRIVTSGARLTQELGGTYMSTHAGFLDESDPVAFGKYVERVSWMRDECLKHGVTLILESGQETAADLAKFMAAVPGVGINFDPANMILYAKGRPMEALKTLYPWIRQVHVKDAVMTRKPGTWGREVPWGEGEVGGKAFIAALEALGYTGNYVIEREGGAKSFEDIVLAVGRLSR